MKYFSCHQNLFCFSIVERCNYSILCHFYPCEPMALLLFSILYSSSTRQANVDLNFWQKNITELYSKYLAHSGAWYTELCKKCSSIEYFYSLSISSLNWLLQLISFCCFNDVLWLLSLSVLLSMIGGLCIIAKFSFT